MALEQLKAEIAMLVQQMEDEPEDIHELHARIRSKLAEIKAMGMPLPDDLTALERRLDREERASTEQASPAAPRKRAPRRAVSRQPAKRAKRSAAKKAKRSPAKKAKRSAAKKSKRSAAKKARGSSAKKSKRARRGRR
jgi:type IV secretory pathway VirB10-like protein